MFAVDSDVLRGVMGRWIQVVAIEAGGGDGSSLGGRWCTYKERPGVLVDDSGAASGC